MGFDKSNEELSPENQLDLFSYNTSKLDFIPDLKIPTPRPPEANKSPRFMTLSVALHIAAAVAVAVISVPLVNEIKTDTITIELEEPTVHEVTKGAPVEPTKGGAPAALPEKLPVKEVQEVAVTPVETAPAPTEVAVVAAPEVIAEPVPVIEKSAPKKAAPKAVAAAKPSSHKAAKSAPAKTNFAAVPMSIDDINSPELDEGEIANQKSEAKLGEDFNQDFDEIDSKHASKLAAEESQMNAMAEALSADQERSLKSVEDQNQADSAALAESQKNLRHKNAKAVASALASEKAAAEAAAREKAAQRAAAIAAANAAQGADGAGGDGPGKGEKQGAGAGNNGLEKSGQEVAGAAEGVRSLDQLKQMPGNPRPQYSEEERLKGNQGRVSFEAYITKDGTPVNFRMKQSTGFRNLDAKTLAALKKWRFYPGQEGWVEIPFSWDLKGGVQEVKGRLRTSVGQLQGSY
ncbi:hypothetical protein DOM22_19400 [Bdellovibrio sp. ZAP7]|uniref:energy transducer TonB n=1 Tax=Bdellovibrio sp. ZAP7 TaxID=2231053 RepID=UPI001158A078|nr:energy transducer TonB [Bdellovibrio sp. ZAP7]QDK47176.1 hypothetical protein DOM22_19400 [Bdellovibrio sp. ZAP7]